MSWNHRVIAKTNDKITTYQVYEVYYDDKGYIESWSAAPDAPFGEDLSELRKDLYWQMKALRTPILQENEVNGSLTLVPVESIDEDTTLNSSFYYELLDRVHVAGEYLSASLADHPALQDTPKLHPILQQAEDALAELYVEVGNLAAQGTDKED